MVIKQIVAIIRGSALQAVEERLLQLGVKGISVSPTKGYGEYANIYKEDRMVANVKLEIFAEQSAIEEIVAAIMETAHQGISGDGIVAVLPVEKLCRIRTKAEIEPHEC